MHFKLFQKKVFNNKKKQINVLTYNTKDVDKRRNDQVTDSHVHQKNVS